MSVSVTLEFHDKFEIEFLIDVLRAQAKIYNTKGLVIRSDSCNRISKQLERYVE